MFYDLRGPYHRERPLARGSSLPGSDLRTTAKRPSTSEKGILSPQKAALFGMNGMSVTDALG